MPTAATTTPAADDGVHKLGQRVSKTDPTVNGTVFRYRQPVAESAPRPDEQPRYEWGAADVRVCATKDANPKNYITNSSWTLVYADDTVIEPSSTGYQQFPLPEYPWGEEPLVPGRCVRGWITYPVPKGKRPVFVQWSPGEEPVPPRWAVK